MKGSRGKLGGLIALVIGAALASAVSAGAAGPPLIVDSWVVSVETNAATLRAEINPNGFDTTYRFEYVTQATYEKSGFSGAAKAPAGKEAGVGSGTTPLQVSQSLSAPQASLAPGTTYRYRAVATNSAGPTIGPERTFTTKDAVSGPPLPDGRAWELVSPVDKVGGGIAAPGALFGGGAFQAAASTASVTYGSGTAFGQTPGAPPASQYLSRRTASGWVTENISTPVESAAYGDEPDGAPYRVFSADLARAVLFGGLPCRGGLEGCPAPNPVLPGSGAQPGYMAYYLRESASGKFTSLLTAADLAHSAVSPEFFEIVFAAASPDLSVIVLSSCAALTANATEVLTGPGKCDPDKQNLYRRDAQGLRLVSFTPGGVGAPGAEIAASLGAVSADGERIYWRRGDHLYLRQDVPAAPVDESVAEEAQFEAASADGTIAFFSKEEHLYRFSVAGKAIADLTPGGGVVGVLGASADGSHVYYQDAAGLKHWHSGATTTVAPGAAAAAPTNFPPATGTARVSPDGEHLAFLSAAELTLFDNNGETEVYLYGPPPGGGPAALVCASCNPTGERPKGSSSIPGALVNGSTLAYKPRVLSANGSRLFFDSEDELDTDDTNFRPDVYQWEAQGIGDCKRSPGCVGLISSGRSSDGAIFVDASEGGSDVFFITGEPLVAALDPPGSVDLYDARVGGGFQLPIKKIPCVGDACQSVPAPPDDPTPGTLTPSAGNPPLRFVKEKKRKARKRARRKGKRRQAAKRGKSRGQRRGQGR